MVKVTGTINETKNIKTIEFKSDMTMEPGQFVMVWLPGIDEIPLALTRTGDTCAITIENVGPTTRAFHDLKIGSRMGIKGPLGNGFDLSSGEDFLLVSGGTGMAALVRAAENMARTGKEFRAAIGARTAGDLFFTDRLKALGETRLATDDGSAGHHGFVTELAEKLAAERRPDMILTCGPEPMMAAMVELAGRHNIPIQCSLERYMKCGLGICGSCQLGKYTVCRDGPVFTGEQLAGIEEFGKWKRDAAGNPVWF